MGTSSFALPALEVLAENNLDIVCVYTQPPRRAGRGKRMQKSPVGQYALEHNLNLLYPKSFYSLSDINILKDLKPDLVLVVAYGLILPKKLLTIPKFGFFNVHASLLPRWRGAAPIQRALLSDDKKTGVSIIKLEPSLDTGPIVFESQLKIQKTDNAGSLHDKLSLIGADLTTQLFTNIENLCFTKQSAEGITYAKKVEKWETQIDWDVDAETVSRQIRAFSPSPGAWFDYSGERIKILTCQVSKGDGEPGLVMDRDFQIACRKGSIYPTFLQRSGKSTLPVEEFLRGYNAPVGKTLVKC